MNKSYLHIIILSLVLFLVPALSLSAQTVILKVPSLELEEEQNTARIDVLVDSFIRITGIQFTLKWDPEVLQFDKIGYKGISGMDDNANFGYTDIEGGILTFYWLDESSGSSVNGITLRNNTALFSLDMNVVGDLHDFTMVEFISEPTVIEAVNADDIVLNYELQPGLVTIGELTSVGDLSKENSRISLSPNPFKELVKLQFDLPTGGDVLIEIIDLQGNPVLTTNRAAKAGRNEFVFYKNQFSVSGTYFLSIKTQDFKETKKLFLVE